MDFSMLYNSDAEITISDNESDDLIARSQAGDSEAFARIFERHSRFIYKFVYAMLGEASAAEEITQETFLAAYRGIGNLRREASLQTWLCAIAKNTVYKFFRANRHHHIDIEEIESLYATTKTPERNLSPDEEFLNKELNDSIRAALSHLNEDKRTVFVLKEFQNLSYREISLITGSSVPKLKTDLRRAKLEMRRILCSYLEAKL